MSSPIIAVLRADHPSRYQPVIDVLGVQGIGSVELTLSTPGTLEAFAEIRRATDPAIDLGIGTVTDVAQARAAIEAGADYLVTPITDLEVIAVAVEAAIPVYPGGLTPTELFSAWRAGARAVKLFPASTVGPGYISHLRGPFPDIEVIPSGGVGIDDVPAWFDAGAAAVSIGGPLLGDALRGGDLDALADRCRRLAAVLADRGANR